jgi:hypothetical protein
MASPDWRRGTLENRRGSPSGTTWFNMCASSSSCGLSNG